MNKQELLIALDAREHRELYNSFDAMPEDLLDTEVVIKWMQSTFFQRLRGASTVLVAVPKHLVNDEVRRVAVSLGADALECIHPEDTDIYLELVLKATADSSFGYKFIHESFKTTEILELIIDNCHRHLDLLSWPYQEWVRPLMTQDMIDRVAATNYRFAVGIGLQNISWSAMKELLINRSDSYEDVVSHGGAHLLVRMIQEGGWPAQINGQRSYRPRGLFELANLITQYKDESGLGDQYLLYCAYLKTFPINSVIKVMNAPERRDILMSLYPHDDLLAHAKTTNNSRALRGMLVEDALGL
jgi:hypothetical protein